MTQYGYIMTNKQPKIDYIALKEALEAMKPRNKLFQMIKAELETRGHWRAKPRGKPGLANFTKQDW